MEKSQEQIAAELCQALTLDYRGRGAATDPEGGLDWRYDTDVDKMTRHPVVAEALRIQEAGIASADFKCPDASSSEVGVWALKSLKHFWENDLYKVQLAYRRGWIGGEIIYTERGGMLDQVGLRVFHHADTRPVLFKSEYAGFRIKRLKEQGQKILRAPDRHPGKAFWHGHDITTERFYGNGLLMAAHRDWQRLAERQGTEPILDLAITRTALMGPKIRFDENSPAVRETDGSLSYTKAREWGRQVAEDVQAGMAFIAPSSTDDKGKYLYDLEYPERTLDTAPLLEVIKHYEGRICYAIGTPRELMESTENKGGYAGRDITMETFLSTQQRYARQICTSWVEQIGMPLCKFHFGPDAFFSLELVPLNETRAKQQGSQPGQPGQPQPGQPGQKPIGNAPPPSTTYSIPGQQPQQAKLLSADRFYERKIKSSQVLLAGGFDEGKHPRAFKGTHEGGQFSKTSGTPATSSEKKKSKQPKQLSEKAQRAKDSAVRVDKSIQRYAEEHNEPRFAKAIGGLSFPDSEPVDIVVGDNSNRIRHGVELKTMVINGNFKITMKRSAMERKAEWERKNKATYHTVVFDDSAVFNADGEGKHDETKRVIYYRRGYGSFRVAGMHKVKDVKELKLLMELTNAALPTAARRIS